MATQKRDETAPKETSPNINDGLPTEEDKLKRRYHDLVEQMQFLYVRIVKARDLPGIEGLNTLDPYVELKLGNFKAATRFFESRSLLVWNQVFAFETDRIQDLYLEVVVYDKVVLPHEFQGQVKIYLPDVPKRVPPESPLAPRWYRLEDQSGKQLSKGDVMLAVWTGTQADEFYSNAWISDSTAVTGDAIPYTRPKVYISPTLWYLRVNVIQAQDLILRLNPENLEIFVIVSLGNLRLRTNYSKNKNPNPMWNEDLMFVAQEPFNDKIVISVEQGTVDNHVSLGRCVLPLKNVDKRLDGAGASSRWYNLDSFGIVENANEVKFASKFNARITLDGAYHVLDEPFEYSSDYKPSAKKLWKSSIGVLELGIIKATDLAAMKMENRTDAYCVAKYGPKWVRTRTIVNSLSPKWNEQYIWEVYDPYTVITIAVFDNNQLDPTDRARGAMDTIMGKIRIRLSTLDREKVYAHSYPLISLQPSGVKKMGEIHLAVRFSWPISSLFNMCQLLIVPLLPRHHYLFPLSVVQLDNLRKQAAYVTSQRLSRAAPPLKREIVDYMLDMRSKNWSMRRGRVNYNRMISLIRNFVTWWKWLEDVRYWKNPITTCLFGILCFLVLFSPGPLLPMVSFYLVYVCLTRLSKRPSHPCHVDVELSCADTASPEDIEEEFDMFPTQLGGEVLRMRYDRLRAIAGCAQRIANDLATIGERFQSLRSWRDPKATSMFLMFCCLGFLVTLVIPPSWLISGWIILFLRHPRFRTVLPSIPQNFLRRMPSKRAFML